MNRILDLRTRLSMTQDEFAELCGISRASIARYEASGNLSRANAEKIAHACGVSVSFVLGDTNDTSDTPPVSHPAPGSSASGWNVEYPAGVAMRAQPQPAPSLSLSEADISRIAEQVAQLNRDAKTTPVLNSSEQQLIEEYRLLNSAGRLRVQRLISVLLDNKFNGD